MLGRITADENIYQAACYPMLPSGMANLTMVQEGGGARLPRGTHRSKQIDHRGGLRSSPQDAQGDV